MKFPRCHKIIISLVSACLLLPQLSSAANPPLSVPSKQYNDFTFDGTIPVINSYRNDSRTLGKTITFNTDEIDDNIALISNKQSINFGPTDSYLYDAIENNLASIANKKVAAIASQSPWYESVILAYDALPTTLEQGNPLISNDPRIKILKPEDRTSATGQFDAVFAMATVAHAGLGRMGDPINPNADIEAMDGYKTLLKKDGLLFLSIPVGKDCLVWNLHRIYGHTRLKKLFKGWRIVGYHGFTSENLYVDAWEKIHQPVFVLRPIP